MLPRRRRQGYGLDDRISSRAMSPHNLGLSLVNVLTVPDTSRYRGGYIKNGM